jgi:hypothetical protein
MSFITVLAFCVGTVSPLDATGTTDCFWVEFSNKPKISYEECEAHISRLKVNFGFLAMIKEKMEEFPRFTGSYNLTGYCPKVNQWENFQREMGVALQEPEA